MKESISTITTKTVGSRRLRITAICLSAFLFYLIINLFTIQYIKYDYYKDKVYSEITTTSAIRARRGNIYDANMNLLATTKTSWRISASPREIHLVSKRDGKNYPGVIADGLSEIFSLDREQLLKKITNSRVLDVTIKRAANEDEYKSVLMLIEKHSLYGMVITESSAARYYPENTLAAHVLGFTGSDNQGLYGLEYYYDSTLRGTDGHYMYAKDANGNTLPGGYISREDAIDGHNIVTTIDSYVQRVLESSLEEVRVGFGVQNRVTGIVMNTGDGSILAMATSSPFNPNTPYELDTVSAAKLLASGYTEGSDEYKKYKRELMEIMWSNKAVSETYEPGSTFKIVTVSAALDSGTSHVNDKFSCHGFYRVGGWKIKCHKTTGHGNGFNLAYGLQMSCNPTMMQIAERMGAETFYDYVERFGYLEKSGIDLPSEAGTIFHDPKKIGSTELATASFGQRFKVSIINHLKAIAAVANGGISVTPHLLARVTDSDGNTIREYTSPEEKRIISENVAKTVAEILEEGVSGTGGARNAHVDGYKVAAKTGTSQKFDILDASGNSYLRISSTVAFAPSDDSGIAVIIVADEPTSFVKYGSVVAAPYVSEVLARALPYLGYKSTAENTEATVGNYTGITVEDAVRKAGGDHFDTEIIGDGDTVISQMPSPGETASGGRTKIILYTSEEDKYAVVPDAVGMTLSEANKLLCDAGFNLRIIGASLSGEGEARVCAQSSEVGTVLKKGCVITLTVLYYGYGG